MQLLGILISSLKSLGYTGFTLAKLWVSSKWLDQKATTKSPIYHVTVRLPLRSSLLPALHSAFRAGDSLVLSVQIELDLLAYSAVRCLREGSGVSSNNHWLACQVITQRKKAFWWLWCNFLLGSSFQTWFWGLPTSNPSLAPGRPLPAKGSPAWGMPEDRNGKALLGCLGLSPLLQRNLLWSSVVLALEK